MGTKTTNYCKSLRLKMEEANKLVTAYDETITGYVAWLDNLQLNDLLNLAAIEKTRAEKEYAAKQYRGLLLPKIKTIRGVLYEENKKFKEYITKKKVLVALSGGFKTKASVGIAETCITDVNNCVAAMDQLLQ